MSINVKCRCGKQFWVDDQWAGKRAKCKLCGQPLVIPNPEEAVVAPVVEYEDGETYGLNPEDAQLEARAPGSSLAGDLRMSGEMGNYYLSRSDGIVTCVAYAADHVHALAGFKHSVFVLNVRSGQKLYKVEEHRDKVQCGAFSPDGKLALSGDAGGGLLLWDVANGRPLKWFDKHRDSVDSVAFAAHGYYALSGGADGRAYLWDVRTGAAIAAYQAITGAVTAVAYSRDGRLVLVGDSAGNVGLWNVTSGRMVLDLKGPALGSITSVSFSADGVRALAAGIRKVLKGPPPVSQWDLPRGGKRLACFDDPSENKTTILCTAFSPEGDRLLAGGGAAVDREGDMEIWYTPVRLWGVERGAALRTFKGHMRKSIRWTNMMPLATVHCVAFSPDGSRGLSGGDDARVQLWGLA
jgi:WD40 repeat protein